ncbi:hypothetical protein [Billgrantia ethanolica]|uniref:Uncharacterized protein n=1 Tax=Billgrantia ethanolica TaxID=2733486 RepID=A0ABS9A3D0_9GAMM|nr:hypothetical protein [Halomonas ethanolica]MCE8002565.1 hypothetical protein [Halomonas ethanolica]
MNKTYDELCDEILQLREQLQAAQQTALAARVDYLEARLARADERASRLRNLEAQLQGEVNELEGRVLELEIENAAMKDALRPFAQAWLLRQPRLDGTRKANERRLERALEGFWSAGSGDERFALTGQHLKDAHDALTTISSEQCDQKEAQGCQACNSTPGQFHAPECPVVNAFTAGRIRGGEE